MHLSISNSFLVACNLLKLDCHTKSSEYRMPRIVYIQSDGTEHVIEAESGATVMETAVNNGLPGIDADCGGACACATCHVHIETPWLERLPPQSEGERGMLQDFGNHVSPCSRLSCQIQITDELEGLIVQLLKSQR